eukprot:9989589-Lingulodinium_polyedra.AAC.1
MPCYATLCRAKPYRTMICYATLRYATERYAILYDAFLCFANTMLQCAVLHYAILCDTVLHFAM